MSSHQDTTHLPPLDLSKWKIAPAVLMVVGGILSVIGGLMNVQEFGYSWLLAFMFFLTIALGALFFVMIHHLTDAGWSVATRRFCEHIAALLFPWLAILFIPVLVFAPKIYQWLTLDPHNDRALLAKMPLFTLTGFCIASAIVFAIWWLLSSRLRYWSLRQDVTGDALCTRKMRFHSGWGILAFAATLTFAGILWMNSLQYQWSSTIYGLYFFAACAWTAVATIYAITAILKRQGILTDVLRHNQFYFLGALFFAFTLLHAYFDFAQYFVIWNGNVPDETFWYIIRANGSWWTVSMILIFGHFFLPFIVLLPITAKTSFKIMLPFCAWAWLMNYLDLAFNILPVLHPHGYPVRWVWLQFGCIAFMGGLLSHVFLKNFISHPPYPQKDPRILEAMGLSHYAPEEMPDTLPAGGDQ